MIMRAEQLDYYVMEVLLFYRTFINPPLSLPPSLLPAIGKALRGMLTYFKTQNARN